MGANAGRCFRVCVCVFVIRRENEKMKWERESCIERSAKILVAGMQFSQWAVDIACVGGLDARKGTIETHTHQKGTYNLPVARKRATHLGGLIVDHHLCLKCAYLFLYRCRSDWRSYEELAKKGSHPEVTSWLVFNKFETRFVSQREASAEKHNGCCLTWACTLQ